MKKSIFLIILIVLFLLLSCGSSFAVNNDSLEYNGETFTLGISDLTYNTFVSLDEYTSGDYNYFYFTAGANNNYVQFFPKSLDVKVKINDIFTSGAHFITFEYNSFNTDGCVWYRIYEDSGVVGSRNEGFLTNTSWYRFYTEGTTYCLLTSVPIYTDSEFSNCFFQVPPQIVEVETVLAPIVENQEMKPLEEILGILPLIIVVVVSFLGFRKALEMLLMVLRRS